jgi:hypothetical protein
MEPPFAPRTVREYLPIINAIYALLEVDIQRYPLLEDRDTLDVVNLEKKFSISQLSYAMAIVHKWLQGTGFEVQRHIFVHKQPSARWSDFIRILDAKILEHQNATPVIVITVARSGRVSRNIEGTTFWHNYEEGSQKLLLLQRLAEQEDSSHVPTEELQEVVRAKSTAVVNKAVKSVRATLESKLRLPPTIPLIDSKRGSGYRIDPMYNLVLIQ